MSSTGKDWGEILSRLNVSWGVKEVANIMSILNKRTTPIDEDEGLVKHVVYSPLIDLHTTPNTEFTTTPDIEKTIDLDSYSGNAGAQTVGMNGWGMRKIIPDNVRAYDLTHDNSNAVGRSAVTHIDFEDRVTDQIGSNDGSWSGSSSYVSTPLLGGKAGDFDGSTNAVTCTDATLDTSDFSWVGWIKFDQLRVQGVISTTDGTNIVRMFMDGSNRVQYDGFTAAQSEIGNITTSALSADTWYHVAATYDDTAQDMKLYLNGSKVDESLSLTNPLINPTAGKAIGTTVTNRLDGKVADWEFYNVPLTAREVLDRYRNTRGIYFPPPGNTQFDATTIGRRHMGGCVTDGSSYMIINDHSWFNVTDEIMISGWFYLKASSGTANFIHKNAGNQWAINIIDTNVLEFNVDVGGVDIDLTYTYTPNTWYQVLAQAKSGTQELWINNVKESSDTQAGAIGTSANNLGIFANQSGSANVVSGNALAWLSIANGFGDATWVSNYFTKGLLNYDTDVAGTPEEITTIPFIDSLQEMPNSYAGMFIGT